MFRYNEYVTFIPFIARTQVWDASLSHIPHKPTYTLHPAFPVRHVRWRPEYECELAIVSNDEFGTGSGSGGEIVGTAGATPVVGAGAKGEAVTLGKERGDAVEIWDVRRGWIAKWAVGGSAVEGGVAGKALCLRFGTVCPFVLLTF